MPRISSSPSTITRSVGCLYCTDNAIAQALDTSYARLTGFDASECSKRTTVSTADDTITIWDTGLYLISFTASYDNGAGDLFTVHAAVNDTIQGEGTASRLNNANDIGSLGLSIPVLLRKDDVVSVRGKSDNIGGATFRPYEMALLVTRIA